MKNKLGIISLIISAIASLLLYFGYFTKINLGFLLMYPYIAITIILSIIGIIVAIRTLFLKEEFKAYPILSIVILISIILFIL